MDRGEFQQDSVLKQLEVLKEEEKEFQNLKVRLAWGDRGQNWGKVSVLLGEMYPSTSAGNHLYAQS